MIVVTYKLQFVVETNLEYNNRNKLYSDSNQI